LNKIIRKIGREKGRGEEKEGKGERMTNKLHTVLLALLFFWLCQHSGSAL